MKQFNTPTEFSFPAGNDVVTGFPGQPGGSSNNFVPTGIVITMDLPVVYNNPNQAILAFNLDGFIPQKSMFVDNDVYLRVIKNMFPVQLLGSEAGPPTTTNIFKIQYTECTLPVMTKYLSHRLISGQVGIALRVSSNTSQSGNIKLTHAARLERVYDFNAPTSPYFGLRSNSGNLSSRDFQTKSFTVADLSLQRHWNLIGSRTSPFPHLDLPFKMYNIGVPPSIRKLLPADVPQFQQHFQEDWLLLSVDTTIPSPETNQLTFEVFYDYSKVSFEKPMLNINPLGSKDLIDITSLYLSTFSPSLGPFTIKETNSKNHEEEEIEK